MLDPRELADRPLPHDQVALSRWAGIELFRSGVGPGIFAEHEHPEVQLSARIETGLGGLSLAAAGSLSITESGEPHGGQLHEPAEFMMVYLHPERLEREADELLGRSGLDIRGDRGAADTWLTSAMGVLHDELRAGVSSPTITEALALSVLTRLVTSHGSVDAPSWSRVRPLSPGELRASTGLLGEALEQGITVSAVAEELGLGTSRFAKAFRATVGVPPYAYLMRQRVRRAEELVIRTAQPLVDIAMECGFASQSHMTAQFKRLLGATPAQRRRAVTSTDHSRG